MKRTLILIALVLLSSSLLFAGETFESLYKSMLHSNPALLKAHEETRKAELDVKDARGSRGPAIEMTAAGLEIYVSHRVPPGDSRAESEREHQYVRTIRQERLSRLKISDYS